MPSPELAPIRVDSEAASAYVLANGSPRDRARLQGIFGAATARETARELEEIQNPDGGFPGWGQKGGPSSIDATCYTLFQMKDLPPLAGSPMASRAVAFLRRNQLTDGSWAELPAALEFAGPWAQPDNPSVAPYLTANAAYTIVTLEPEHLEPVYRAASWLRKALAGTPGAPATQTLGLCWALFYRLYGPRSTEANWSFQAAMQQELPAYELAWVLACGLEVSAGGKFTLPTVAALSSLAAMQEKTGGWPGEPGLEVEATLTALRVFRGFGVI